MPYRLKTDQAAYARRYYLANKALMKSRGSIYRDRHRQEVVEFLRAAKAVPCTDCGVEHPYYVMHFDHVRGEKIRNLADTRSWSFARVRAEIAKCEVVCANCHAERTHQRRVAAGELAADDDVAEPVAQIALFG